MSKKAEIETAQAVRYSTERLLKSKALAEYQPDFARTILTGPEYTIEEAKAAIDAVLREGD